MEWKNEWFIYEKFGAKGVPLEYVEFRARLVGSHAHMYATVLDVSTSARRGAGYCRLLQIFLKRA